MHPRGLDIASAAKIAGVGRTTIYEAIKTGALPAFKFGRRTIIYRDDLQAWMNAQPRLVLVKG
ncbi:MAG: helix-turn-helix domain-containing protein [Phreatobacter sp.]|nr:helix-turn-helix domain-containing protein [Phreatobacter sp.]